MSKFNAGTETVVEWVMRTRTAHKQVKELAEEQMNGPQVLRTVPFTFKQLKGVMQYDGVSARVSLKWGLMKVRKFNEA